MFGQEQKNSNPAKTGSKRIGPTGMTAFLIIWIGQVVSLLGTVMIGFTLTIWVWLRTRMRAEIVLSAKTHIGVSDE